MAISWRLVGTARGLKREEKKKGREAVTEGKSEREREGGRERRCEDVRIICVDVKMICVDVQMRRCADVKMICRCEDLKMICVDVKMYRCENV